ncbi:Uncharacterised protein [Enterobacter cloacae]|nr:Uncharacterised protein [Enterobacter cloacae]
MTLTHAHLHLRQQQQHTADGHQHYHHLQRAAHLLQHLPDLFEDRADIQQAHRRKFPVKLRQHAVAVFPAEAGEPALGLSVQRTRREDEEEVWSQAFPVHFTQAGNFGGEILGITGEGHAVAEVHLQACRQPLLHRHFPRFRRPGAGNDRVMVRTFRLPGQVEFAIERFILISLRRLAVDLRQAGAHDRIERFRNNVMLRQETLQRRHLFGSNVDQEIVRAFRRKLLLPAIQQIPAQHQQKRQQHKRQRKCRELAEGRPRLVQQSVNR